MRAIISGGGTGGHIFPAIAIANELKQRYPDAEILFVGAKGRMEMEKVPEAGFPIEGLWISGLQRRLTSGNNLLFPIKVLCSFFRAKRIIRRFQPQIVIGVGGYSSGPTLKAALSLKVPCLIQEQNSFPGITNRLLANKVDVICVAYAGMEKWFPVQKTILTGNPVRKMIAHMEGDRTTAHHFFGLDPNKKTVLVVGGSLGARTINRSIAKSLSLFQEENLQLMWQTGKHFFAEANTQIEGADENIKIFEFIQRMDLAYMAADIIVSRAGAIAISELCLVARPTILVPSPNVSEDHQTKNAQRLVERKAAIMVADAEAEEILGEKIRVVHADENLQKELSQNIKTMGIDDAALQIVNQIDKLIENKR